jgi:hypothetical protein
MTGRFLRAHGQICEIATGVLDRSRQRGGPKRRRNSSFEGQLMTPFVSKKTLFVTLRAGAALCLTQQP